MRPVVIAKALVLVLLGIYLALGLSAAPKQARSTPVPPSSTGQESTPCADRSLPESSDVYRLPARTRRRQGRRRLRALQCRNPHTE